VDDYDPTGKEILDYRQRKQNLRRTIAKTEITLMNPIDPQKKLLVLDLDQTLFDIGGRSQTETLSETMRPGLFEFLEDVYEYYNIAIWSATSWSWLEIKLFEFSLLPNPHFKFVFVLDRSSMFNVKSARLTHTVKPLPVIWENFPYFSERNTIHVDDIAQNFAFNFQSGLRIKTFRYSTENVRNDRELPKLAKYLIAIGTLRDFTGLDHRRWKEYLY